MRIAAAVQLVSFNNDELRLLYVHEVCLLYRIFVHVHGSQCRRVGSALTCKSDAGSPRGPSVFSCVLKTQYHLNIDAVLPRAAVRRQAGCGHHQNNMERPRPSSNCRRSHKSCARACARRVCIDSLAHSPILLVRHASFQRRSMPAGTKEDLLARWLAPHFCSAGR